MMAPIFANQEHQRLTNTWVTNPITDISSRSGCAIEAAPTPQPVVTLPPARVRAPAEERGGGDGELRIIENARPRRAFGKRPPPGKSKRETRPAIRRSARWWVWDARRDRRAGRLPHGLPQAGYCRSQASQQRPAV